MLLCIWDNGFRDRKTTPDQEHPIDATTQDATTPFHDGIHIAFDDHRLVNNAGLILPATLARHLGLPQLVRQRLDLGDVPGQVNTGDKIVTTQPRALAAGAQHIGVVDAVAASQRHRLRGKAPSTLGTFLRSFRRGTSVSWIG